MKLQIILLILCNTALNLFSQSNTDTTERLIQIQLLSSKEAYYLVEKDANIVSDSSFLTNIRGNGIQLKYTNDDGQTFRFCNLESVLAELHGPLNYYNLNIQFVNQSLGFIYGYSTAYAFYPFLFRTEDGGQTWQTIFAGPIGTPLRRSDFFMFDDIRGIIIANWDSEPLFNYMLTEDGGKTWRQHTFQISRDDIRIMNADGMLSEVYSEDGKVTIIFVNPDGGHRGSGKALVLQSNDFGATFNEPK